MSTPSGNVCRECAIKRGAKERGWSMTWDTARCSLCGLVTIVTASFNFKWPERAMALTQPASKDWGEWEEINND